MEAGEFRHWFVRRSLVWLLLTVTVYVVWAVFRSTLLDSGVEYTRGVDEIGIANSLPFILFFACSAVVVARSLVFGIWFLGCVSTLSIMPAIPNVPFFREYGHIVIAALAIFHVWRSTLLLEYRDARLRVVVDKPDMVVVLAILFVGQGIMALLLHCASECNAYILKVSLSETILYGFFVGVLAIVMSPRISAIKLKDAFAGGMILSAIVSIVLGYLGLIAILLNSDAVGNDTALGFGYWDRLKSTFPGPDQAGIYYAATVPILLYFASSAQITSRRRQLLVVALMLIAPLIIATGSRTARIAVLPALLVGLTYAPFRRTLLVILPVYALAYYFGFFYRSIVGLINVHFGDKSQAYKEIATTFWSDSERLVLAQQSASQWFEGGRQFLMGIGPGLAGYSESGFPNSHATWLDLVVEQGLLGVLIFLAIIVILVRRLVATMRHGDRELRSMSLAILTAFVVVGIGSITYDNHTWVFVWYLVLFGLVISRLGRPAITTSVPHVSKLGGG